ncbi:MAG: thioredoxin family protein [Ignisphaera sp.]
MIGNKYEDFESNSEVSKILDRIVSEYSRGSNLGRNACCNIPLNGVIFAKSYREFIDALESCKVVFVLITTTHCPYCKLFKPIFYRTAEQYSSKAAFIEVNADFVPEAALMFNVYSTPTTVVLIDGKVADGLIGYIPANYFKEYIDNLLDNIKCIQS